MKYIIALALAFCTSIANAQLKKICVMGSSTAYGYFIVNGVPLYPKDSAWAFKLKKYYKDLNTIDTLYNIAVLSANPYHGMPGSYTPPPDRPSPYYPFNVTRATQYNPLPYALIVNYPSNQYDSYTKAEIIFCLQTIKDSANAAGMLCYITTSQPRNNFSPSERIKLKDIRDTIMTHFGPAAIDFYTDITDLSNYTIKEEYNLGDGIHLNPAGHTLLFQRVLAANIFQTALPVTLLNFTAQKNSNKEVALQWTTLSETNSSLFEVQRSNDGVHFSTIATINATGNTTQPHSYHATDMAPAAGANFYRIIAINSNGQKQYSTVVKIIMGKSNIMVKSIYPNPVRDMLQLHLHTEKKSMLTIGILSAGGKLILREQISVNGQFIYEKNCAALPAGAYILHIEDGNEHIFKSFVKQ